MTTEGRPVTERPPRCRTGPPRRARSGMRSSSWFLLSADRNRNGSAAASGDSICTRPRIEMKVCLPGRRLRTRSVRSRSSMRCRWSSSAKICGRGHPNRRKIGATRPGRRRLADEVHEDEVAEDFHLDGGEGDRGGVEVLNALVVPSPVNSPAERVHPSVVGAGDLADQPAPASSSCPRCLQTL